MIGWAIFFGIIGLFMALLSIPVVLRVEYTDTVALRLRWLFITILRIPKEEKPEKKKKEKKKKPKKEEKKKETEKPEVEKEPNIVQRFYKYQGIPGFIDLLKRVVAVLKKFGRGVWWSFRIRELKLYMTVMGGEPDELVAKYGKTCAVLYPALGWLTTHIRTKPDAVRMTIAPDFTGLAEKEMAAKAEISLVPLILINAVIFMAIRMVIRVLLKFLKGAKVPKGEKEPSRLTKLIKNEIE